MSLSCDTNGNSSTTKIANSDFTSSKKQKKRKRKSKWKYGTDKQRRQYSELKYSKSQQVIRKDTSAMLVQESQKNINTTTIKLKDVQETLAKKIINDVLFVTHKNYVMLKMNTTKH